MRRLALLLVLAAPPALAVDMGATTADLDPVREVIAAEDWPQAIGMLRSIVADEPGNADALNLLAYSSRKSGDLESAASFYRAALAADPEHLGALEYQGELFITLGDRAAAEANLARLTELCGSCEEREELAAALAGEAGKSGY